MMETISVSLAPEGGDDQPPGIGRVAMQYLAGQRLGPHPAELIGKPADQLHEKDRRDPGCHRIDQGHHCRDRCEENHDAARADPIHHRPAMDRKQQGTDIAGADDDTDDERRGAQRDQPERHDDRHQVGQAVAEQCRAIHGELVPEGHHGIARRHGRRI